MARELRTNERIRSREVRVIGANQENYGVISFQEAMGHAREAGLDLVEVDANANPPVCRILDYGKFKYEQAKKEREGRKHQKGTMIHEVRLRPRTGQHDIDLKVRIATRLLGEGDKVKLSVMFRGRELSHPEVGQEVLDKALKGLGDLISVEKPPGMEGRFLTVILTPSLKKPVAAAAPGKPSEGGTAAPKAAAPPKEAKASAAPTAAAAEAKAPDAAADPAAKAPVPAAAVEAKAPAAEATAPEAVAEAAAQAPAAEPSTDGAAPAAAAKKAEEKVG